jgi:Mrp family chromosome partitioning ATPase
VAIELASDHPAAIKVLLVSSPLAEDGKTTTVANLAVAYVRAGRRVIAIDADLRRPMLGEFFGLRERPGLSDVVMGDVSLDEGLTSVAIAADRRAGPNRQSLAGNGSHTGVSAPALLSVLPAGARVADPAVIIDSDAFAAVLRAVRDRADVVLLDTPPLLAASDTVSVARQSDAVVMLVKASAVARGAVVEATRLLAMVPVAKLGFVLTGAENETQYGYGGYGVGRNVVRPVDDG